MGFHYGTNSIPGFIAELAAELAATDDFTMHDDQAVGGYCLRYKDQNLYMLIETVTNGEYGKSYYYSGTTYYARFAGIGVRFSTGWNLETHAPADTIRRWVMAPLFCASGTPSSARLGTDSNFQINYWIDKYGFVGVIQNPYSENEASGVLFACEFLPDASKEFSDGYTNVMAYTKRNYAYWGSAEKPPAGSTAYYYHALRPFGLAETGDTNIREAYLRPAMRSSGNSKIYFEFPTYENDIVNWQAPIAQTRRWFFVQESGGMSLNDVVSWMDPDKVTVHKFFITAATSPDTANKVIVAIPYENAYQY